MFVDNERGSLTATEGKLQLKKSKMIESPTKFYLIKGKNRKLRVQNVFTKPLASRDEFILPEAQLRFERLS